MNVDPEAAHNSGRAECSRVCVIIPNWNGAEFLPTCLESLHAQTYREFETVVVDNGSSDGSVALIESKFPQVSLIRLDENRGFGAAMNIALRDARSDYVACLNNDTEADRAWLGELVACLERHPRAAAATSKMLDLSERDRIDDCGDILTAYFRAYARGRGEQDRGQYDEEEQVFGASGGASLWRSAVVRELGYFDEDLFAYYEDVDLSFRAHLAGHECWYAPRAVVFHAGGGTSRRQASEFAYYHSVRNRWSMIVKNGPTPLLWRSAPRIFFAELLSLAKAATEGKTILTLKAHRDVLRALPRWARRRKEVQRMRTVGSRELRRLMSSGYPSLGQRILAAATNVFRTRAA
ncbi:MAG: glycosyltransferase family 2 protein [Gaiellaceae bacterium]